ncbi:bifunctional diguanylate cyclase/phosphodiesterase [Paenibacillus pinistramenti]|uniref:bifunctional diguanylate cyclase/phosphodiesterase n=1 Tax=Paenibacillus pinistramenti TaxID=1768003 RepID=UPI001109A125|nr:bifunctional diguanylate cyclase/phosphodiesterase [Paenibacillus pinistramenti]
MSTEKPYLMNSATNYRKLHSMKNAAVFQIDMQGNFTYLNEEWEKLTGYPPAESLGQPFSSYVDWKYKDMCSGLFNQLLSGSTGIHKEICILTSQNEVKKAHLFLTIDYNGSHEASLFSGTLTDLASRKPAIDAFCANEANFRFITDHLTDMFAVLAEDGLVLFASPSHTTYLGRSLEEYIGSFPMTNMHPDDWERVFDAFLESVKNGTVFVAEYRYMHSNGQWIDIEMRGKPISGADGKIQVIVVSRDISLRKKMEGELRLTSNKLKTLINSIPYGIKLENENKEIILINEIYKEMIETGGGEESFIRQDEALNEKWNHTIPNRQSLHIEEVQLQNGRIMTLDAVPIVDCGQFEGYLHIYRDITKESEIEQRLKESEQRYKSLFDYNIDSVATFDMFGHFIHVNSATETITGYSAEELIGSSCIPLVIPEEREKVRNQFYKVSEGVPQQYETRIFNKSGEIIDLHAAVIPYYYGEKITGIHCIIKDITEKKRVEDKLNYLAFHDPLTGLANRLLFEQSVKQALRSADESGKEAAIAFLDLDRFKTVNDTFGHRNGDLLLRKIAARLQNCLRQHDTICRQGGDEFLLLLNQVTQEEAKEIVDRVLSVISEPYDLEGSKFIVTPSIGVSFFPSHADNVDDLIRHADAAMYRAKGQGKNQYIFYESGRDGLSPQRLEMEMELRNAVKKSQFSLCYQPQMDLARSRITGFEALIRWNHPVRGMISPSDFIPLAEETGLIVPMGEWVLRKACEQLKCWHKMGFTDLIMSVNLSMRQFNQRDLLPNIANLLAETGLKPEYLELEITESMTSDIEKATTLLSELKKLGVRVAIDDFGTGYSSLNYLKNLPIDRLKIDRSFVRDITISHSKDKDIVATIIAMGHNLKLEVIAEGVETQEQLDFLKNFECDQAQGYFFFKPMSAPEVDDLLLNGV